MLYLFSLEQLYRLALPPQGERKTKDKTWNGIPSAMEKIKHVVPLALFRDSDGEGLVWGQGDRFKNPHFQIWCPPTDTVMASDFLRQFGFQTMCPFILPNLLILV